MCNNNGACRARDAGVMCPSYRATGDEQHLTRGRANTLRLALTGQLGPEALVSDDMRETMALCISCKGCKRECPTGVDMARMKIEFLHHYRKRHGLTPRDRLIAYLPRYAPYAARIAPLMNLRNRVPALAALGERLFGLSAKRRLPSWSARPYAGSEFFLSALGGGEGQGEVGEPLGLGFRSDPPHPPGAAAPGPSLSPRKRAERGIAYGENSPAVVLLVDTFNRYFEPENARAAERVLNRAGYRVISPDPARGRPLCCGRTFLSAGLVDEARREARRMLDALSPYLEAGTPIVGLEPSCLLTLRDEFSAILPCAQTKALAERAQLFEEFVESEYAAGRFQLPLTPMQGRTALLHGHCHQKAFGTVGAAVKALQLIPGLTVETFELELLRHGWILRLRGRALRDVAEDRRARRVAPDPRGGARYVARSQRHELPAPDRRWRRPRSSPPGPHPRRSLCRSMMVEELDIVFDPLPPEPLTRFVTESLASFNVAATGLSAWYPVGFFLKSRNGEWLGGLLGHIWGGWLQVTHLWIASAVRRQRYGTRLLQAAEDYAVERGCIGATLETTSFEARPFYEKRGYEVFATLDDYPPGHSKFFLRKRLTRSAARPGEIVAGFLVRTGERSRPRATPPDLVQKH